MRYLDNPMGAFRALEVASGLVGPGKGSKPGGTVGGGPADGGGYFPGPTDGGGGTVTRDRCTEEMKKKALAQAQADCEKGRSSCREDQDFDCSIAWDDKNCLARYTITCTDVIDKEPLP